MIVSHYIKSYPEFLTPEECDQYVEYFEETLRVDKKEVDDTSICVGPVRPDGHQICGSCNCQRLNPMGFDRFTDLNTTAMSKFQQAVDNYRKDVLLQPHQWPVDFGWEQFRMKRFLCGTEEQFSDHVDVTSHEGAKRFLILMVYLNDNFNGGETEFPILGDIIRPEKGMLLMFPPMWTFLHRGNPPVDGYAKYFLMTYLNYGDFIQSAKGKG